MSILEKLEAWRLADAIERGYAVVSPRSEVSNDCRRFTIFFDTNNWLVSNSLPELEQKLDAWLEENK